MQAAVDEWIPKWYNKVDEFLPADKRFLTGDSISIYDFQVAGILTNMINNPNSKDAAIW